jgi:hypothetical protein
VEAGTVELRLKAGECSERATVKCVGRNWRVWDRSRVRGFQACAVG